MNNPTIADSMKAKADEHDRIQRELRDIQRRAEADLQEQIAKQWVEKNAAGMIPKIEAVAVQGGRSYRFSLHPDTRYSDCSGAWHRTFVEVKQFFEGMGFDVIQETKDGCASTAVRIIW